MVKSIVPLVFLYPDYFILLEIARGEMPRTKNNVGLRHEAIGLHIAGLSLRSICGKTGSVSYFCTKGPPHITGWRAIK